MFSHPVDGLVHGEVRFAAAAAVSVHVHDEFVMLLAPQQKLASDGMTKSALAINLHLARPNSKLIPDSLSGSLRRFIGETAVYFSS